MGWGWDYVKGLAGQAGQLGGVVIHGTESARVDTVEGFEQAGNRLADDPAMATVRPQGMNPHDIYLMFHGPDAKDTGSLDASVAGWRTVSGYHAQVSDALKSATSKLTAAWQGDAAESAGASVTALREAADTASQRALRAGTVLEQQSAGWNDTAHKVTDVPADPPQMSIGQVDPVTPVVSRTQATTYTSGQQANQQALSDYGSTTSTNSQNVPQFAAPAPQRLAQPDGGRRAGFPAVGQSDGGSPVHQESGSSAQTVSSVQSVSGVPGASGVHGTSEVHGVSSVQSGQITAETHSAWQIQGTLPQPDSAQAPPGQAPGQAMPMAGMAAGGAGMIAGGGALMGASLGGAGASDGPGIGSRLAGGESSAKAGSPKGGSLSSSGTIGEAEETTEATPTRGARSHEEEDNAHRQTDYLVQANPHGVFGHDGQVAPPVFGDEQDPAESAGNA